MGTALILLKGFENSFAFIVSPAWYMNNISLNPMIRGKVRYFRFLFDKGFELRKVSNFLESLGNWYIEFESADCFLVILSDRSEIFVRIYPIKSNRKLVIGLNSMIFYLSKEQIFIGNYSGNLVWGEKKQVEQTARLLKQHIDQIVPYTGSGFQNIVDDYKRTSKKYMELQIQAYRQK